MFDLVPGVVRDPQFAAAGLNVHLPATAREILDDLLGIAEIQIGPPYRVPYELVIGQARKTSFPETAIDVIIIFCSHSLPAPDRHASRESAGRPTVPACRHVLLLRLLNLGLLQLRLIGLHRFRIVLFQILAGFLK